MSHKLFYALTDQRRAAIDDFIIRTKFQGNRDKFIQNGMMQQVLMTLENLDTGKVMSISGEIFDFDVKKALATDLPKKSPKYEGQRGVFVVGEGTHDGFVKGCKIENYMRRRNKTPAISLEEYFNNFVNTQAIQCLRANRAAMLEAEFKDMEAETQNKDSPQK